VLSQCLAAAFDGFYQIMTARSHLWRTFKVTSSMCPHVDPASIETDRENLKDNVFRIKHAAEFLYDEGDSMISLEKVRELIDNPPAFVPGPKCGFCDFAGSGDESVFALCEGNRVTIEPEWCWRSRDTMHSVGKFLTIFRKLGLRYYHELGGDQGFGHQLMDRMAEQGFNLQRTNNGSPAKQDDVFFNASAEAWSTVGQLIEKRQIIIPNDEKLIAQVTSRRKPYDSCGRERLESKADLKARGGDSPDRADAVVGAVMMRLSQNAFAFDPAGSERYLEELRSCSHLMERSIRRNPVERPAWVDWNRSW
jgi:phage terminase large subunit